MILESDLIILDDDVKIENGDFVIQNANAQNLTLNCISSKGTNRIFPTSGFNMYEMRNEALNDFRIILAKIKSQLKSDNYRKVTVRNDGNNNLEINGTRNR